MNNATNELMAATGETDRLAAESLSMLARIKDRVFAANDSRDDATVRWLHKRIVAIERDAQKREGQ